MSSKTLMNYGLALGGIALVTYVATHARNTMKKTDEDEEYELIRQYLLNDEPLGGSKKPKLWIHSKNEVNSRHWKSFYSRNTTDLNQPYIHLTVKTIINHCGADFNICLIDDETFSRLIPGWDIKLATVTEPFKSHYRELALTQLLYIYGGMVVPDTFLCKRNLFPLYLDGTVGDKPFVCETVNRSTNLLKQKHKRLFMPNTHFMGSPKRNAELRELVDYLKRRNLNPHFTSETDFLGDSAEWCMDEVKKGSMNLVGGELIGTKTGKTRKPIIVDDLMAEAYLDLLPDAYGIYIDEEEMLTRTKYQWFPVMPAEMIFESKFILAKHIVAALIDTTDEYYVKPVEKRGPSIQNRVVTNI